MVIDGHQCIHELLKFTKILVELTWVVTELTCSFPSFSLLWSSSISLPLSLWVFNNSSVLFFNSSVNHSTFFSSSSFSCLICLWHCYDRKIYIKQQMETRFIFWIIVRRTINEDCSTKSFKRSNVITYKAVKDSLWKYMGFDLNAVALLRRRQLKLCFGEILTTIFYLLPLAYRYTIWRREWHVLIGWDSPERSDNRNKPQVPKEIEKIYWLRDDDNRKWRRGTKKVVFGMLSFDFNKWKSSYILYKMKSFSIW